MPSALFISPHLDDAAFSCGGTAARLSGLGWRVGICTVFTASVPDPGGFALACQTDKGIPASEDYMALRRAEDSVACAALGAEEIHLSHPEAPHRGYESAPELFSEVLPNDNVDTFTQDSLVDLIHGFGPDLIFSPQGLGRHVDHMQVIRAIGGAAHGFQGLESRLLYYRDAPYALRSPEAVPAFEGIDGMVEKSAGIKRELPYKLRACAAYASQLGFQFGGVEKMRKALTDFSLSEGRRLGVESPSEAYLGAQAVLDGLEKATKARHV